MTNVRVGATAPDGDVSVSSNFIAYRNRLDVEADFYVGRRQDTLRVVNGSLKIASRLILLDQAVLTAKNMTILFQPSWTVPGSGCSLHDGGLQNDRPRFRPKASADPRSPTRRSSIRTNPGSTGPRVSSPGPLVLGCEPPRLVRWLGTTGRRAPLSWRDPRPRCDVRPLEASRCHQ